MNKLFVITKYIKAKNAKDAILKEKKVEVHEIWLDGEWKKGEINKTDSAFGIIDD